MVRIQHSSTADPSKGGTETASHIHTHTRTRPFGSTAPRKGAMPVNCSSISNSSWCGWSCGVLVGKLTGHYDAQGFRFRLPTKQPRKPRFGRDFVEEEVTQSATKHCAVAIPPRARLQTIPPWSSSRYAVPGECWRHPRPRRWLGWRNGGLVGGPLRRPAVVESDDAVRRLQRLGVQRVDVGRVEVGAVVERVVLRTHRG